MNSSNRISRVAGFLYLCIIVFGIFAEMVVRSNFIVPGDATATVNNIIDSESLFRLGFISDLLMMTSYLLLGFTFYQLFKSVDKTLAALIVLFVMAAVPVMFINMLNQFAALIILDGGDYLNVFAANQLNALVLLFLNLHKYGYLIPGIFFGLWLLPIGLLSIKSGYFPKILGIFLLVSCCAYLINFFAAFLLPGQSEQIASVMDAPAALPEFAFCLWLLLRGAATPSEVQSASELKVSTPIIAG